MRKIIRKFVKIFYNDVFKKTALNPVIKPGEEYNAYSSQINYKLYKKKIKRIKTKQFIEYNRRTQRINYNLPYVFLPLHAQPERTTNPIGGIYVDQPLIVDQLLRCIPDNWYIYVKEHKVQFDADYTRLLPRKSDFHNRLQVSERVVLVDIDTSPFELIDSAKAVATVSGDAGWEAVNRRVPVLLFGAAWYYGCEGVFYATDYKNCKNAIDKINNGYSVDYNLVKLFAYALQEVGIKASIHNAFAKAFGINDNQTIDEITSALEKYDMPFK